MDPWPFSEGFEFQKARKFCQRKVTPPLRVEPKLDGERLLYVVDLQGHPRAYSRRRSDVTGTYTDKWRWVVARVGGFPPLPAGSWLDGELLIPGGTSSQVKSVDALVFRFFSQHTPVPLVVPAFGDVGPVMRLDETWKVEENNKWLLADRDAPHEKIDETRVHLDAVPTEQALLDLYAADLEGVVVKDAAGKWWKVKHEHTLDLIVVGFVEGRPGVTGQMLGLVGAYEVAMPLKEYAGPMREEDIVGDLIKVARVGTGFDMDERDTLEDAPKRIGQIMEVKHRGWAARGRLRHPGFVRWRTDK